MIASGPELLLRVAAATAVAAFLAMIHVVSHAVPVALVMHDLLLPA